MYKQDIKLVVCDIDGSLVTTDHVLTDRAKDVIKRLHEKGIYFGIASGRSIQQHLSKQAEVWGFDFDFELLIAMTGADVMNRIRFS